MGDSGNTWRTSTGTVPKANEGELALAPNGSLVMNSRWTHSSRLLSWSDDGGETWSAPINDSLPLLSGAVEGSMIRVSQYGGGSPRDDLLLTASPYGPGGRCNMTVWASDDSGASWDVLTSLDETYGLDPSEAAAYSSMVQINNTHFALAYERHDYGYLTLVYLELPRRKKTQHAII